MPNEGETRRSFFVMAGLGPAISVIGATHTPWMPMAVSSPGLTPGDDYDAETLGLLPASTGITLRSHRDAQCDAVNPRRLA